VALTDHLLYRVRNEIFSSNSYILREKHNEFCLLIDPGLDTQAIDKKLTELNLKPIAILATHGHFDHIGSVSFFKNKFKIPFYMHEADLKISQSANFYLKIARIDHKIETPKPDVLFKEKKEIIKIGNFELCIYSFPGHSAGSCIIKHDKYLFTGDILYKKGLGFNNFPGEDKAKLKHSIQEVFEMFSDDSLVLPGHGDSEFLMNIKNNNQDLINFLN
jgi:glyoxylase-like metal-dependent hydrolase (beta-lactamase superfamily II)